MIKQLHTWKLLQAELKQGNPVMLLYVVDSIGSSPGRRGFFMGVSKHGVMAGSIGGGIMEHKFVELAKQLLEDDDTFIALRRQVHNKKEPREQSGMICSGEQTIALLKLRSAEEPQLNSIVESLQSNRNGLLQLSEKGLVFKTMFQAQENFGFIHDEKGVWAFSEIIGYKNTLHIIGGGHCALALSQFMSLAGFYVIVYDDRKNLYTIAQNSFAHIIKEVSDYSELHELFQEESDEQYAIIMTFGYRTDSIALRAIMDKPFKYLGLLGSQQKIIEIMQELNADGIDQNLLDKIHAPAGLHIGSREPEEIAISIAAEIIQIKNSKFKSTAS